MRVFKDFDEIKSALGTEVGVSDWVIVTQDRINRFAEATGDELGSRIRSFSNGIARHKEYLELRSQSHPVSGASPRRLAAARPNFHQSGR